MAHFPGANRQRQIAILAGFQKKYGRCQLQFAHAAQDLAERKSARYRIHANGQEFPVRRRWETGFSLSADSAPNLRGLVDLYDGARHVCQCLIVTSAEEAGERVFEYKRATAALDKAPLDFERAEDAPIALLPR